MSKLSELLAKRGNSEAAPASVPTPAAPPAAPSSPPPAGKPNLGALFGKKPVTVSPSHNPDALPTLDDVAGSELTIVNNMTDWPDSSDGQPSGLSAEFRQRLDLVRSTLNTADVSDVLVSTLTFLHDNPALKQILLPEDVGLLIQALQSSHGIVLAEKAARSAKKTAKQEKSAEIASELSGLFDGVNLFG